MYCLKNSNTKIYHDNIHCNDVLPKTHTSGTDVTNKKPK